MESEGTFARQGKGGYARVLIEIDLQAPHSIVEVALNDDEWNNQLHRGNFDDWFKGAIYGVRFALRVAGISTAAVRIKRIVGLEVDSNPTNIAAAAADAVWKAVEFDVPPEVTNKIIQAVLEAWKCSCQLQPFD